MPIAATTRKNFYKDSVALMRISQTVGGGAGLARVSLLMGTPANKDILGQAGLLVPELGGAAPADLMILVEGEPAALAPALEAIEAALAGDAAAGCGCGRDRAALDRDGRRSASRARRSCRCRCPARTLPPKR